LSEAISETGAGIEIASQAPPTFKKELAGWMPALHQFAHRLCRDASDAEDMVQVTALKALLKHGQFRQDTDMKTWLFSILRNTYYNELVRRRRHTLLPSDSLENAIAHSVAATQENHAIIQDATKRVFPLLGTNQRAVLILTLLDYSQSEIAEQRDCPVGTVKSNLSYARQAFDAIMEELEVGAKPSRRPTSNRWGEKERCRPKRRLSAQDRLAPKMDPSPV